MLKYLAFCLICVPVYGQWTTTTTQGTPGYECYTCSGSYDCRYYINEYSDVETIRCQQGCMVTTKYEMGMTYVSRGCYEDWMEYDENIKPCMFHYDKCNDWDAEMKGPITAGSSGPITAAITLLAAALTTLWLL